MLFKPSPNDRLELDCRIVLSFPKTGAFQKDLVKITDIDQDDKFRFYTEPEAAEMLRCAPSKVKRLRLAGKLTYVPGRPVLIAERDIREYLSGQRVAAEPLRAAAPARSAAEHAAMVKNAEAWAQKALEKRRAREEKRK
jgi:hypothetical protein